MKKIFFIISICLVTTMTGCQTLLENDSPIAGQNNQITNPTNQTEGFNLINRDRANKNVHRFGFVRHQRETALPHGETTPEIAMYDPELLADTISKLSILIQDVDDVATLVTDQYVLVAYNSTTAKRFETADQVKQTAMSVIPRFYHVYVSDDPQMMQNIERFAGLSPATDDVEDVLDDTIRQMLVAPQGRRMNASENENGEYDRNMRSTQDTHNYHLQRDKKIGK